MVCYYPNCKIEIYEPSEAPEIDCYTGEPLDTWDLVTICPCDMQPFIERDKELQKEVGTFLQDTYKCYVEQDTPITDKSRIKIVGEDKTYTVLDFPQRWYRFHHFMKVIVKLERHETL